MRSSHVNERGSHTTVIEHALPIVEFFKKKFKKEIKIAPGKIEGNVGAKSKTVKFKHINNEVYEMVITHKSSRQEFKVFTTLSYAEITDAIQEDKKLRDWNCGYTDMRHRE